MSRTRRQTSASRSSSEADLDHLTTEVLRLCLDQLKLATTGSRNTLLGRLRPALRGRNDPATSQDTPPATDQEPPTPRSNDHSTVKSPPPGSFMPDQLNTLKCLIASSIQDARPPISAPSIAAANFFPVSNRKHPARLRHCHCLVPRPLKAH